MTQVAFHFRLHQPMRLHPERDKFLWNEMDREIFTATAEKSYIPALKLFTALLSDPAAPFKIILGISGTFLEQAEMYCPEVIRLLQDLIDAAEGKRIECLDETYYHSYVGFFADPRKGEFRDQVSLHRESMKRFFGCRPVSFCHTDLIYTNEVAAVVGDMGYRAMLCEKQEDMFLQNGAPIPPDTVLKAKEGNLLIIPRNSALSSEVISGVARGALSPADYAGHIREAGDQAVVLLTYNVEHIGDTIGKDNGIFEFWEALPTALYNEAGVEVVTAVDLIRQFENADCPTVDAGETFEASLDKATWHRPAGHVVQWLAEPVSHEIFKDIERLEPDARKAGGELLRKWRYLTTSDHLSFLHEPTTRKTRGGSKETMPSVPQNPYGGSIAAPAHIITRKVDNLEVTIKRFQVLKRREKTAVLIISPETGKLPPEMGALAQYISGKSGGLGGGCLGPVQWTGGTGHRGPSGHA